MGVLVSPDPIAKNDVAPTEFPAIVQGSGPTAIPVLANDQDKQGGPLLITSVTQATKGTVTITGGGTGLAYDPTGFASGTDSFRYTIVDNQSRTNSATVVIVISKATPTGSLPMARIVSPTTLGTTTAKVRVSWAAPVSAPVCGPTSSSRATTVERSGPSAWSGGRPRAPCGP